METQNSVNVDQANNGDFKSTKRASKISESRKVALNKNVEEEAAVIEDDVSTQPINEKFDQ